MRNKELEDFLNNQENIDTYSKEELNLYIAMLYQQADYYITVAELLKEYVLKTKH